MHFHPDHCSHYMPPSEQSCLNWQFAFHLQIASVVSTVPLVTSISMSATKYSINGVQRSRRRPRFDHMQTHSSAKIVKRSVGIFTVCCISRINDVVFPSTNSRYIGTIYVSSTTQFHQSSSDRVNTCSVVTRNTVCLVDSSWMSLHMG